MKITRRIAGSTYIHRGTAHGVTVWTTTRVIKRVGYTYRLINDGPNASWRVDFLGTAGRIYESAAGGQSFPTLKEAAAAVLTDRAKQVNAPKWLVARV